MVFLACLHCLVPFFFVCRDCSAAFYEVVLTCVFGLIVLMVFIFWSWIVRLDDLRYYFSVAGLIVASAGFYAMIFMGGMRQLFGIEEPLFWIFFWITFLVFAIFGLVYYVPRLRNAYRGEMVEDKYYSLRAVWIQIVVVSMVATYMFAPYFKKNDLLAGVPDFIIAGGSFLFFAGLFCYLSFYQRSFRQRK